MIRILPAYLQPVLPDSRAQKLPADKMEGQSFGEVFRSVLSDANQLQADAASVAEKFALGEVADIHDVMIAAEKAGVAFELVMEIRNKLVEAYQELMRMQM